MDRNGIGILVLLLLFLIVAEADVAPDNSTTTSVPPPSTTPNKKLDHKPNNLTDPISKGLNNSDSVNLTSIEKNTKDSNKTDTVTVAVSPPPDDGKNQKNSSKTVTDTVSPNPQIKKDKDDGKNSKSDDKISSVFNVDQNCTQVCRNQSTVACIASFESGSKELVVLVQNGGEETVEVNFSISSSVKTTSNLTILQHKIINISLDVLFKNISLDVGGNTNLTVKAGHWECVLHLKPPVSERTYFLHLPSYDKLVTPINGAYLLILTGIIFGGTWTCCKFRKRRRQGGVPYQELEMGIPESVSATSVETAEGWDQGWDDDWDEENAVKSPGGRHVGSISANGLTSRSSNRDGWENDWDD